MSCGQLHAEQKPTGALDFWVDERASSSVWRDLFQAGRLVELEGLANASKSQIGQEAGDLIARLRCEYSLDDEGMLRKLRPMIGDATADDLRRWREAGEIQHRVLDGKVRYFRREPSNLFRFCEEAKRRRKQVLEEKESFVLAEHLAQVIEASKKTEKAYVKPVRHRAEYILTIPPRSDARLGSVVRCWLPYPREHERQRDITLVGTSPAERVISSADAVHRTVYLEQKIEEASRPIMFRASFEFTSYAYYPILDDSLAKALPEDFETTYLMERSPHIRFTPDLLRATREVIGTETNPLRKARRIFEFVDANIRYCAEEEYCLIPSFTEKALRTRRGDCGIQATLFIAMCRAAGIPARWQSGWQTKPSGINLHDWAEFYVEPWGWLAADPSYGLQKSDHAEVRYFYFGHQDSYRMIVNSDLGALLEPAKQSARSEPADFQRGEVEIDGRNLYFNEWDYEMKLQWRPIEDAVKD